METSGDVSPDSDAHLKFTTQSQVDQVANLMGPRRGILGTRPLGGGG